MTKTKDLADLGSGFISPEAGAASRPVEEKLSDIVSVRDFSSIATAAASGKALYFPAGIYAIDSNVSFTKSVELAGGAIIKPASGVTVTFSGAISAGRYQIFDTSLGGSIASSRTNSIGYPEWFGAVIDSSASASINLTAIQSTLDTFSECNLSGGDYWISDTLSITAKFKKLQGNIAGIGGNTVNGQTRLLVNSTTADCIRIGDLSLPRINDVVIRDIQIARSGLPQMSATSKDSAAGIRIRNANWTLLENVWCANHIIGVYCARTVRTYMRSCRVLRTGSAATNPIASHCIGFWLDGTSVVPGLVSNNASMYMYDCGLTIDPNIDVLDDTLPTISIGLYAETIASDLFIDDFEIARAKQGMVFNMASAPVANQRNGMQDVHIKNVVFDVISNTGIEITNMPSKANIIRIDGGYINTRTNTAGLDPVGLRELNSVATTLVTNVQFLGRSTGSTAILSSTSSNSIYRDCCIIDCDKPYVQLGGYNNLFDSVIKNTSPRPAVQAAIQVTNGSRSVFRPIIDGDANVFPKAIEFLGSPQNLLEVDTTQIFSPSVSGGSANILHWKGSAITTDNSGLLTNGSDKLIHTGFIA